jgi:hypothetical protein
MLTDHSACAALFGICGCEYCNPPEEDDNKWYTHIQKWGSISCGKIVDGKGLIKGYMIQFNMDLFWIPGPDITMEENERYKESMTKKGLKFEEVKGGLKAFWEFFKDKREELDPLFVAGVEYCTEGW